MSDDPAIDTTTSIIPSPTSAAQKLENLGIRVRETRNRQNLSLQGLSKITGVPAATLSRIENNKMSPTLPIILKILSGLNVELSDLLSTGEMKSDEARLSVTRFKQGSVFETPTGDFLPLHTDLPQRSMGTNMITITPQPSDAEPEMVGHSGEEFFCLIEGTIMLKVKGQPPVTLHPGDTAYFNSTQPHVYVALNNQSALGVIVHFNGQIPDASSDYEFYRRRWDQIDG